MSPVEYLFLLMAIDKGVLQRETSYKTSRSGGKGGQNVNKVSSKVELLFSVENSALLSADEKVLILRKLQNRLNKDGLLQVVCDEERSQYLNKAIAVERLLILLNKALHVEKIRKPVRISKAAKAARVENKRINAAKKESRGRTFYAD